MKGIFDMALIEHSDKTMKLIYPKSYNSRPHVTTQYDDSALTNGARSSDKNLFLIGSATEGDPNKVYEIKSSAQARAVFGKGDLVEAMELIWNPSGKFFQNGGIVYAQRVESAKQAKLVKGPLTFTSKVFGLDANKVTVALEKDALSGAYNLTVGYEPKLYTNTYTNLGNIFSVYYDQSNTRVQSASYKVTGDLSGASHFVISVHTTDGQDTTLLDMDLTTENYKTVGDVISAISGLPGFYATPLHSCANISSVALDVTGDQLKTIGTVDEPTTITSFYGDLAYATRYDSVIDIAINRLGKPTGVSATPTSDGIKITAEPQEVELQPFSATNLAGGSNGVIPVSWADKFKNVHGTNTYYIIPLTAEENIHAELREFLNEENILGYNYIGWVGGGFNESVNQALNRQINLRSDRIALVANSGYYTALNGQVKHIPAYLMAAYVAGVASSLGVGEGTTNKYLELTNLDQNFDGNDLNTLDENGIIAIESVVNRNQSGGFRVVEDVTTFNSSNEPVKNLVSLRELTDFLFDDLRIYLEKEFVGSNVVKTTGSLIATFIEAFLKDKVNEELLASYDRDSIQCTIEGNAAYVAFSCAPARELRTILVSGTYTNFTSSTNLSASNFYNGVNPDTTSIAGIEAQNRVQTQYL